MYYEYPKSVEEAAKLLDSVKPNWYKTIDIAQIDMTDDNNCILGQLYDEYASGIVELFGSTSIKYSDDKIFGRRTNKSNWVTEINERLVRGMTFGEAMQAVFDGERVRHKSWHTTTFIHKSGVRIKFDYGDYYEVIADEHKEGWSIVEKPLTYGDLKAGDKFTISHVKNCIYTKSDIEHKAIYEVYKVATVLPDMIVELVK